MKLATVLAVAGMTFAQEPSPKPADPQLHADVVKLIELIGVRAGIQRNLKELAAKGKVQVMQACNGCDPAFGEEWAKRMVERIRVDDFIAVYVRVYEKYFNDDEIKQLIVLQEQVHTNQQPTVSDALKQKLSDSLASVQSEILGGTTQIGAKLGADIGREIGEEHPEYLPKPAKPE